MVAEATPSRRYTIDDLAQFPEDGKRRELVNGQIVEWTVPNFAHGFLMAMLAHFLLDFVDQHELGTVVCGDTMVRILGSEYDARGADIAVYARDRFPQDIGAAATEQVPDLVVEIISPTDRAADVQDEVRDWLRTGVKLLWYINPQSGVTAVYRGNYVGYVDPDDTLSGDDILPGFTVRLCDILQKLAARATTAVQGGPPPA